MTGTRDLQVLNSVAKLKEYGDHKSELVVLISSKHTKHSKLTHLLLELVWSSALRGSPADDQQQPDLT